MESVCPERARAVLQVAKAARDCTQLHQPKWKAYGLLAAAAAAQATGLDARPHLATLDRILVPAGPTPWDRALIDLLREASLNHAEARLHAWLGSRSCRAELRPLVLIELLVVIGQMDEARRWVERIPRTPHVRNKAQRLVRLGLAGHGRAERFVARGGARALLGRFAPSLPLIAAAAGHPDSRDPNSLELLRQAARTLPDRDCQLAMVEVSPLAYAIGGRPLAASFADAPRYPSLRRRAWARVRERQPSLPADHSPQAAASHLRARSIAERALAGARALQASSDPLTDLELGLHGRAPLPSTDRAAYDEGLALGPHRRRSAQALVRAAGRDLGVALAAGTETPRLAARRRTLCWLDGERVHRRWTELILRCPRPSKLRESLFSDLAAANPSAAIRCLRERAVDWLQERGRGTWAARILERLGACAPGFEDAWDALAEEPSHERPGRGARWVADLVSSKTGAIWLLANLDSLIVIHRGLANGYFDQAVGPLPPADFLRTLDAARLQAQHLPLPDRLQQVLASDEAFGFFSMGSECVHPVRWTSWHRKTLRKALAELPPVTPRYLRQVLGRFRTQRPASPVVSIDSHRRLRFLEPSSDLLNYLRFADGASCCWNSSDSWWRSRVQHVARQIIDPLSFVYHLEERSNLEAPWLPRGFVMGGLALGANGEPLAVLNGLYLKSRRTDVRAKALGALEQHLRVTYPALNEIGIARKNGGWGSLPATYEHWSGRMIQRLRALDEAPCGIQDDIGGLANGWCEVRDLHWKALDCRA